MQPVALYLATHLLFLQIFTYVELSGGQNPWNNSHDLKVQYLSFITKDDREIQLTMNKKGPFPSCPSNDEDRECTLYDLQLV